MSNYKSGQGAKGLGNAEKKKPFKRSNTDLTHLIFHLSLFSTTFSLNMNNMSDKLLIYFGCVELFISFQAFVGFSICL